MCRTKPRVTAVFALEGPSPSPGYRPGTCRISAMKRHEMVSTTAGRPLRLLVLPSSEDEPGQIGHADSCSCPSEKRTRAACTCAETDDRDHGRDRHNAHRKHRHTHQRIEQAGLTALELTETGYVEDVPRPLVRQRPRLCSGPPPRPPQPQSAPGQQGGARWGPVARRSRLPRAPPCFPSWPCVFAPELTSFRVVGASGLALTGGKDLLRPDSPAGVIGHSESGGLRRTPPPSMSSGQ